MPQAHPGFELKSETRSRGGGGLFCLIAFSMQNGKGIKRVYLDLCNGRQLNNLL